jgi:hypothetical protein
MNKHECNDIIMNWDKKMVGIELRYKFKSISECPTSWLIDSKMDSVVRALNNQTPSLISYIDTNKLWESDSKTIADRIRSEIHEAFAYADAESHLAGAIQALVEITAHRTPESVKGIANAIAHLEEAHTNLCSALVENGYKGSW